MDVSAAIVGGGISGLSTAYYLAKAGIPSLIEARPRFGGLIQTCRGVTRGLSGKRIRSVSLAWWLPAPGAN